MSSPSTDKPVISFRISEELKAALQRLAEADERSLASYVERALRAHVEAADKAAAVARNRQIT